MNRVLRHTITILTSSRFSTSTIFDRSLKSRQRNWASHQSNANCFDYLHREAASRLVDRIDDIAMDFPEVLELGSYQSHVFNEMLSKNEFNADRGIGGIRRITISHTSGINLPISVNNDLISYEGLELDEENLACVSASSYDMVISSMAFHWINDLPSTLQHVKRILRPDGVFLCSMLGGHTLKELKHVLYLAELERRGGVSPHFSPLVRPSDAASLMQSAGFGIPTIDVDSITVEYSNMFVLLEHISAMGEGIANINRKLHIGKETLLAAASLYQEIFGTVEGYIPATFELIYMIGWGPSNTQLKPLPRGSAQVSMKDIGSH